MIVVLDELFSRWRKTAALLEEAGASTQAHLYRKLSTELESEIRQYESEALTLEQAEEESGYPYSTLQQKVAKGEIENVGQKGRPRIRRADLPRKARSTKRAIADAVLASHLG